MRIDVPPPFPLVRARVAHAVSIPLATYGTATCTTFDGLLDGHTDHVALSFAPLGATPPLVRIHSECLTGDVFGSERCDCGPQLAEAMGRFSREGGVLLYLRQEGRGIGLAAKLAAYALQDGGLDTYAANRALGHPDDARDFRVAAQMLDAMGLRRIRLLTNNPDKQAQLEGCGINVVGREPTGVHRSAHNGRYLAAKRDHAGHALPPDGPALPGSEG